MKRLFTTACGVALICNFALAQSADTTLARIEPKENIAKETTSLTGENPVTKIKEASTDDSENEATTSTFKLPTKSPAFENKVGPNGEELFIRKHKFYYINGAGKKIKIKSSELRDKPKSS